MTPTKTPTSSLSVIELLFKRAWYRPLAAVRRICSGGVSLESSTTLPSPAAGLPFEIIEMIIAYLAYNRYSLRACTLTCYSWYIAAVPHLHRTLVVGMGYLHGKYLWPNPIRHMHTLGLLPFVKRLSIHGRGWRRVSSKLFDHRVLRQFSALANVRELEIDHLNIPSFMPNVRRYFGHFSPTVQFLALKEPRGSCRQIIYFIGLFQHLQNLTLTYDWAELRREPADDLTLVPPFTPPLRGALKLRNFTRVDLLKDMIDLFGGVRFRCMDLFNVAGMRLLLDACAKTLRTVTLYPTDPRGERLRLRDVKFPANDFAARSSLQDFDLSRNKSLWTLEIPVSSIDDALASDDPDTVSRFLRHVLSTITSPVFHDLFVIIWDSDIRHEADEMEGVSRYHRRFEVLREVRKVQDFQLVLDVRVLGYVGAKHLRMLEKTITEERARKGFDSFFPSLLALCGPWGFYTVC